MTSRFQLAGLCIALLLPITVPTARGEDAAEVVRRTPFVEIIERACQSTVNIHTEKRQKSLDVVFSASKGSKINGMGTGIIIDERGYIVTNFHVVEDVERLRVTLKDRSSYEASVVAFDARKDLAILKINASRPLPVALMGTSSDLMLGEDVAAIGNAFGYEHSVTRGIVSSLSRDVEVNEEQGYENLIQTDAAINPGNSGGPLINAVGEVIGINVAIRQNAQRIGFAIPIDDARNVIARLIDIERHDRHTHGVIAVDLKQGADRKLVVQSTKPDSPAALAGLLPGDVIVRSGEIPVIDKADLERSLFGRGVDEDITIVVDRNGDRETLKMRLAQLNGRARPSIASTPRAPLTVSTSKPVVEDDRTWSVLGLKLAPLEGLGNQLSGQPYRGGLKVVDVRSQSPADLNGIQNGDVLVGLHIWETISQENVDYVLGHPQLPMLSPLKFYILREGETLFGHFQLMGRQKGLGGTQLSEAAQR